MSWAKLDDAFYDHPKVMMTDFAALGLFASGLAYAARHLTDGKLVAPAVAMLSRGDATLAPKLVASGLWDVDPTGAGGWVIHDYLDWNVSANDVKILRNAAKTRMKAFRLRSPEQTANERRTNAFVPVLEAGAKAPSRAVRQNLKSKKQERASALLPKAAEATSSKRAAEQLIEEINRLAGTKFRLVESNLRFARGRLREYAFAELTAMLTWRWKTWGVEERRQWFRPETVLNETKCGSYMGQYDAEVPRLPRAAANPELARIAERERELGLSRG